MLKEKIKIYPIFTLLGVICTSAYAEEIYHNGYLYNTVQSQHTGRIWLDRNIGADRVCQNTNDEQCYGGYFQWGRDPDGHEKSTSFKTRKQAKSIKEAGGKFIIEPNGDYDYDWAKEYDPEGKKRQANWAKTDGSGICPRGFRVPTIEELEDDTVYSAVSNTKNAFESLLKLPSAGHRHYSDGLMCYRHHYLKNHTNLRGYLWSNTTCEKISMSLAINPAFVISCEGNRAYGLPVRCIKEETDNGDEER
jgi:hypothetical protein